MWTRTLTVLLLGTLIWAHPAMAQRLALLIGNQSYDPTVGELFNPHKDIAHVGAALKQAGFEVVYVRDASRSQMLVSVQEHAARLQALGEGSIGFVYYTGHGAANPTDRKNYLIPVTLTDPNTPTFWFDSVALEEIQEELTRGAPDAAHIVVFDACRSELRLGRGGKNFVPIATWPSIFVAFSTGENDIATDGDPNAVAGPYAQALAEEIGKARRVLVPVLFERVRSNFRGKFQDTQFPSYFQGLTDLVYIDGNARARQEGGASQRCSEQFAATLWAEIERAQSPGLTTEFLRHCRGTASGDLAENWLAAHQIEMPADVLIEPPDPSDGLNSASIFTPIITELESDDTGVRRNARSALASGGLEAIDALLIELRPDAGSRSYRMQLGSAVALTEFLRSDKSQRQTLSTHLIQDDINWLVSLSGHQDRTLRVYASEFLYDLGDPRVVAPAVARFSDASDDGKYNLALVLKGAAPFVPQTKSAIVRRQLSELRSNKYPKTTALLNDAIALLP